MLVSCDSIMIKKSAKYVSYTMAEFIIALKHLTLQV